MPNYQYPGTGTAADSHPYATPQEHGLQEPFALTNPLNAAEGPGRYSDNMWYQLESLHDVGVQMALLQKFRQASVYRSLVPTQVALRTPTGAIASSMTVKGIFDMEPNYGEVGARQIWFNSNYTDTFEKSIVFNHYADKVALHEYDDKVQAYLLNNQRGLIPIARGLLGQSMTVALDILARNAFLDAAMWYRSAGNTITSGTGVPQFNGIGATAGQDLFNVGLSRSIWRQLAYLDHPMAANPNGTQGTLFCVTTPDAVKVVKDDTTGEWYNTHLYADPKLLLRYEVGMWDNTRFINTRRNVLWNCGDVDVRTTIATMDYGPGDGASPNLVDKVYKVGQQNNVENWIEVASTAGLAVGDIVTIHKTITSDFGVTDGVDYREPTARVRRIVDIDAGGTSLARITFDKPLFQEFQVGDYITKGKDIHCSVYIAGPAVVNGVGDPIMAYPMPPIDDARAIYRFVWKGRFKYQLFNPEFVIVFFHAGEPLDFGIGTAP